MDGGKEGNLKTLLDMGVWVGGWVGGETYLINMCSLAVSTSLKAWLMLSFALLIFPWMFSTISCRCRFKSFLWSGWVGGWVGGW